MPADGIATALELMQTGGPVVALLAAMSVLALAIVLTKLIQLRGLRLSEHQRTRRALQLWRDGRPVEALNLIDSDRGPLARIVTGAMRGLRQGLPEAHVREEAMRLGGDALDDLRSWFRPLEVIATLAPLLGLFGTVLGMIEAFRQLEAAGNQVNPAILSGGIWEALLTTAAGLAVAIPTVAALNWLERRTERFAHDTDSAVSRLFTCDLPMQHEPEERHAGRGFRDTAPVGAD
ncbi:MAG: MotA/TolQ/ExbB proton channel family protein [Minwuia sp.]|uniref:MotA/TolQ/ExbB proton channel family protein n=1 Tax=Minwuia sp. TaxID=2493630 RepID=UPI003A86F2E5